MPDGLVHESKQKLRAHYFLHTGTRSATGLNRAYTERDLPGVAQIREPWMKPAILHSSITLV